MATGFGAPLALPLMQEEHEKHNGRFKEEEALNCIQRCMMTLYHRDAHSWTQYHYAIVTTEKSEIVGPIKFKSDF